ncbi:FAD-binding oxidoreductase [Streptomyces sp. JJ38]|uniref:FAD-binding oxidoreductase n=1 Tax=Streptomyces sp. JJ38 TaxID=2738128 RepID=UPI001C559E3F|nr:FAD-binding oxidoreductase [Streptomyces sp. JJ38]MBW1599897.1 FAD-binding oxidoreductase [Streptomyces sp. JJ38]
MDSATLETMRTELRGPVITPSEPGYAEACELYNAMIHRHPAAFVGCRDAADVIAALTLVRDSGQALAVRGGGHSGAGLCLVDDGVTLDLSPMRWVRVDPEARTAQVGGGALLGDLDHATHAFGLATPAGIMSTTGVGGLTLGGGHGYLSRKYGLTIDNLLAADVVLADGRFVTASEDEHPDLFWALRGGGGNFGVVTSFTLRLHPVDTVGAGMTVWPVERTREVLTWYREYLPQAGEDVYGFFNFLTVPPGPPFPEELHGRRMCGVVWCYLGDLERLDETLSVVGDAGPPAFHFAMPMPYPALQSLFDEEIPPGLQWYWRGDFYDAIPDGAVDVCARYGQNLPSDLSTLHLYPVDGAVHRVRPEDTAFGYRDALWSGVYGGIDPDPANAEAIKRWCVEFHGEMHPYSMGGSYVNMLGEGEGEQRVRDAYRENYERLGRVKRAYDPENLFRATQNIPPAPAS